MDLEAVEICAGAGGQALGLERAGFEHALAVELDAAACATLRANRPGWKVAEGDVADPALWRPRDYRGVALLAGGVPCPPFTVAGRQLGAADERDLFAWAVELCGTVRPRALLLENVRGLSTRRFGAYRQHVLDRLAELGYVPGWRLLQAADFGVPQLRPRTVLVALLPGDAPWFRWPSPSPGPPATVGQTVGDLMGARGWPGAAAWARRMARPTASATGGGNALPICRYRAVLRPLNRQPHSSRQPCSLVTISQVSLGRRAGSASGPGAASAIPMPSTPRSAHARLARVGPRSAPPCFFEPPTMVGAIRSARRAQAAAPGQPRAAIRSPTVWPTVAGGRGDGDGQRNQGASCGRSATSTVRGLSCGTP